jgi:ParB family transcriptional regulator, chromosome partitioning protein
MTLASALPSTSNKIAISDIKVGNRFRKDLGDIDSLAQSIQDIGLLHPIVVNENNQLVAGQRRLEAYKRLGWSEIPCVVVNIKDMLKGEYIENTARKDFTFSERQAILEQIESKR